jgi:HEAT repeat protein
MRSCPYCGEQVDEAVAMCARCGWYAKEVLLRLLAERDPKVREQAVSDLVYLVPDEEIVRALAAMLRDPAPAVRQAAGLQLFICGKKVEPVAEALIAALDDADVVVQREAAAALSMIGPAARAALPKLATLRNAADDKLRGWVAVAESCINAIPQ